MINSKKFLWIEEIDTLLELLEFEITIFMCDNNDLSVTGCKSGHRVQHFRRNTAIERGGTAAV